MHKDTYTHTHQLRMRKKIAKGKRGKSEREEKAHHLSLNGPHDVSYDVAFEERRKKSTLKNIPSARRV